jgi:hypothetical protein
MSKIKKMFGNKKLFLPILIFIFTLITYFLTSPGKTPYDHFIRLASSFLNGKYYITENPTWLSELIPAPNGTFYIVYPPMPAIILSPIVLIFGSLFEQQYLAHVLGALTVFLTYKISLKIKNDIKIAIWSTLLVSFGTIIWYLSSAGSSWYLAQVASFFFLMAALSESLDKKRPFLVGLLLGASYLSRLTTILSFPFFLYLVKGKKKKNIFMFLLGILPFLAINFGYNYLRFGTIFDKGYILIPGVLNEIWYQKGLFNLSYIPRHLRVIFATFPIFQNKFPYIIPSWMGLSIWITTPAFIYSLFSDIKEKIVKLSWIIITLISLVIFSHGTTGFTQFGYRFAVDFYPFLIFLTIKGASKSTLKWHHLVLLIISVIVNLWGVVFINKFNWVRY